MRLRCCSTTSYEAVLQAREESTDVSQSGAGAKAWVASEWNGSILETPPQEGLGWEGEQKPLGKAHPEGQELKESKEPSDWEEELEADQ